MSNYLNKLQTLKIKAEIAKLKAETHKITIESNWYFVGILSTIAITVSTVIKLFI